MWVFFILGWSNDRGLIKTRKLESKREVMVGCCLARVGRELGDSLGALGDGVLGELSGEDEADGGLDLPGGEGGLAVLLDEASGLSRDLVEGVVDEGVHDGHGLLGDSGVGVDLCESGVGWVRVILGIGFVSEVDDDEEGLSYFNFNRI